MDNKLSVPNNGNIMESVIINGDLSKLTPTQRVEYYLATCRSLGLNELTRPFDYITLNGKLTLYARKDATDQIRVSRGVSIVKLERERMEDIYIVTAYAVDSKGRQDSSIGAVNIGGLKGDALANAIMKAETKAKRRVTLSICGLGMLDETEIETIPSARPVYVQADTGEIVSARAPKVAWDEWRKLTARAEKVGLTYITPDPETTIEDLRTFYGELVEIVENVEAQNVH